MTILALETSCDDTCAAVVDDGRARSLANVISSQEVHERFGGVVPEIASRHHLELVNAVVERALERGGRRARRDRPGRRHAGPRARRRAARRPLHGQGARGRARAAVRRRSTTCRATWRRTSCAPRRRAGGAVRAAVRVPDRQRRAHAARARARARRLRGARAHARRRRRRGVRQGRADARARLSRAAPRSSAWPRTATRRRSRSPGRAASARAAGVGARQAFARGPRLLLRGAEDGAALHAARARRGARRASARADLAASYQAAIVDSLLARAERALERTGLRAPRGRRRRRRQRRAARGGCAALGAQRARAAARRCAPTTRR